MDLTAADVALILQALDSHVYWQLSDEHYRSNGEVLDPGSDDPEKALEIAQCRDLSERLSR